MEHVHHATEPGSALRSYLNVIRRRKWVILAAVVLVPLVAVLLSLRQEKLYRANAQVLLSHQNLALALSGTPDQSAGVPADRVAQTQATLARVANVARATLRSVGLHRSVGDFLAHSSVKAESNADVLDFSVTDPNPALAARLATAYARQFTIYRAQLDTASLRKARAEIATRLSALDTTGEHSSPLYRDLTLKDQQLATMEALQTANASLVQSAGGASQVQPRPVRNGMLGLALGLFLGVGLAFLWEALDTRVRSAEEIGERLGLPLLVRAPAPSRRLRKENRLVMFADPRSVGAEAFRMLRTNLEFVRLGHNAKTIMITSAVEQEGKSTTVANLAIALARAGQDVALVDLDLRRPFLNHFFIASDHPGLTQVAIGQATLDDALIPVAAGDFMDGPPRKAVAGNGSGEMAALRAPSAHQGSLHVMVSGPIPPNAGEFAGSETLAVILSELRGRFDTVLIDAPPVLQVGDAMALSAHVDAVLVVARMNVVRRSTLSELRRHLDASPALKLGFIVTDAGVEQGYGYGYGSSYGYGGGSAAPVVQQGKEHSAPQRTEGRLPRTAVGEPES